MHGFTTPIHQPDPLRQECRGYLGPSGRPTAILTQPKHGQGPHHNVGRLLIGASLSCSIRLQWVPKYSFLPVNDAANKLVRWEALVVPSAVPCSFSPLISRIHSSFFLHWRCTVSLKSFDTQVPSIFTEELVLPCHTRCALSRLRCNGHSLLLSCYLSRIGRIENPSCSVCRHSFQYTSHLILHCPATDPLHRLLFDNSLSLYDL